MQGLEEISFDTVPALWQKRETLFKQSQIDLKDTTRVDVAGIALLVQWAKALPQGKLKIVHAPTCALNLINTYRLSQLFNLEE